MRWLAVLLVVAALPADARPVRDLDRDFRFEKLGLKHKLKYKQPPPCPATTRWSKFERCQLKHIKVLERLHDAPTVKLVAYTYPGYPAGHKRIELYLLHDKTWVNSGFYAESNPTSELLRFAPVNGDTFRVDMGYANQTWVTLDEVSSRPAMLRRQYSYFCSVQHGCRTVMTACDVLVHGKAVSTFRAVPKLKGAAVELYGDGRGTNRYCVKPANLIEALE